MKHNPGTFREKEILTRSNIFSVTEEICTLRDKKYCRDRKRVKNVPGTLIDTEILPIHEQMQNTAVILRDLKRPRTLRE